MQPHQAVGWALLNASAVTAFCGTRIHHGKRPEASSESALPSINFYEMAGGTRSKGIGALPFSISCRAVTAGTAYALAERVIETFNGSSGSGMYGLSGSAGSTFDVARVSLRNPQGLIPEPDSHCYNAPVDILLIYPLETVS